MPDLQGFHHITAITGDAPTNVDFYCRVMGMRMVKKTVNFDAPEVYHLYYADETGTPGGVLTFFEFPGARLGQAGAGMVHRIGWTVASEASLNFWGNRLLGEGIRAERRDDALGFHDREGLGLELVATDTGDPPLRAAAEDIPAEHALLGFAGVHAFSATFKTTGSQTLVATDTVTASLTDTKSITVNPAAAATFVVTALVTAISGTAFTFTVTAYDLYGNVATGYAGTVHFTSSDGDPAVVLPANYTFTSGPGLDNGVHAFSATLQTAGSQTITATDTVSSSITGVATIGVAPGQLLSTVAAADADFKHIDGFDVLFGKGSSNTLLKVKNTNPGTFHYLLTLTNETGTTIHDNTVLNFANGATSTVILTVPALPASVGVTIPSSAQGFTSSATSAFWIQGSHSIHVHPDDRTDDMPVTIQYSSSAPGGDCAATSGIIWSSGQPADGTLIKCIKITGFSIPKHHSAKIDVTYDFALKGTDLWPSNAQTMFRAGFSFKSATTVHLDSPISGNPSGNYSGNQVAGIVGAGQQVTAVGGFVYDRNGNGVGGATIKLFNSASGASCANTAVAQDITTVDGFYFIWAAGSNQSVSTNSLASGVQYYVMVCNLSLPQPNWPARSLDHKLGNKEFDEEDFYVSTSSALSFTQQPTGTRAGQAMGTVKVAVVDYFGNVVTGDNATSVTLAIGAGPSSATLSGTTTMTVVGGVATFTGLSINLAGNGYSLVGTSPPLTGATSSSFNISK